MKRFLLLATALLNTCVAFGATTRYLDGQGIEGLDFAKSFLKNGNFEKNVVYWNEMSVTITSGAPSGAPTVSSSAAAQFSFSRTTTALDGDGSLSLVKAAANAQGTGICSDAFSIGGGAKAKVINAKIDYELTANGSNFDASGTSTQSFEWWLYDTTNSAWVQPSGYRGMNQNSGPGQVSLYFQSANAATSYRLCGFTVQTGTTAWTLSIDNVFVGQTKYAQGTPVTDFQTYTATFTNHNTLTFTQAVKWRRVGDSIEVIGRLLPTGGTGSASAFGISLPSGLTTNSGATLSSGEAALYDASVPDYLQLSIQSATGSNTINFLKAADTVGSTYLNGNDLASSDELYFSIGPLPITGWSSNVQMSNDTDTRVVSFKAYKTAGSQTSSGSFQDVASWSSASIDTHAAWNSTTGVWTVPVSGLYVVHGQLGFSPNATGTRAGRVVHNSTTVFEGLWPNQGAGENTIIPFTVNINAVAGDTIKLQGFQSSGGSLSYAGTTAYTVLNINRLSGPSVVAANETVAASAGLTTAQTGVADKVIPFNSEFYDTHNVLDTTTNVGRFTAPISGLYEVEASCLFLSLDGITDASLMTRKNGSNGKETFMGRMSGGSTTEATGNHSEKLKLVAGDYIEIWANGDASFDIANNSDRCFFSIMRVGN